MDVELEGWATWKPCEEGDEPLTVDFGPDLGTVAQPRESGSQDLTFATSEGKKTMGIERFATSELGCVMVVRNGEVETIDEETGEKCWGYHTAIGYQKHDYQTGELLLITSYYAASDEELRGLTEYEYQASFGGYREESDASQTLSF